MWTSHLTPGSPWKVVCWLVWFWVQRALGGSPLRASPQRPASRPADLQASFPLSEPRMNVKTINMAIRVVKNTLSDTRSKVTRQRAQQGMTLRGLLGKQRESGQVVVPCHGGFVPSSSGGGGWPPLVLAFDGKPCYWTAVAPLSLLRRVKGNLRPISAQSTPNSSCLMPSLPTGSPLQPLTRLLFCPLR